MTQPSKGTSKLADSTGKPQIGERGSALVAHSFVFTTDDPGLTAADATTIADGDLYPADEGLQFAADISAKVNAIIDILETHGLIADN